MALLETLATGVGASVANALLKMWLKDEDVAAAAAGELSKILIKKIPDFIKRGDAEASFLRIRNISADSVDKMLKKEAEEISGGRLEIIANAAGDILDYVPITVEVLSELSLNDEKLLQYFLNKSGGEGGHPGLAGTNPEIEGYTDVERLIYRRILAHASQLIVDMASSLPKYNEALDKELFRRFDDMAENVVDGMNLIVAEQADAFEGDYRGACVRKWDQLELFGVDLNETNKRYNLSIAYVTLMVEQLRPESGDDSALSRSWTRSSHPSTDPIQLRLSSAESRSRSVSLRLRFASRLRFPPDRFEFGTFIPVSRSPVGVHLARALVYHRHVALEEVDPLAGGLAGDLNVSLEYVDRGELLRDNNAEYGSFDSGHQIRRSTLTLPDFRGSI